MKDIDHMMQPVETVLFPGLGGFPPDKREDRETGWFLVGESITPQIVCGGCKGIEILTDHKISIWGDVSPSILCFDEKCNWHVYGVLLGWDPRHEFCGLIAYLCLMHNLRDEIADKFDISKRVVGSWGMGVFPDEGVISRVLPYAIYKAHTLSKVISCTETSQIMQSHASPKSKKKS